MERLRASNDSTDFDPYLKLKECIRQAMPTTTREHDLSSGLISSLHTWLRAKPTRLTSGFGALLNSAPDPNVDASYVLQITDILKETKASIRDRDPQFPLQLALVLRGVTRLPNLRNLLTQGLLHLAAEFMCPSTLNVHAPGYEFRDVIESLTRLRTPESLACRGVAANILIICMQSFVTQTVTTDNWVTVIANANHRTGQDYTFLFVVVKAVTSALGPDGNIMADLDEERALLHELHASFGRQLRAFGIKCGLSPSLFVN